MNQIDISCISTASVAKLGGVTPSRIRQLNMEGLISPTKIEGGRHFYDAPKVLRVLDRIRAQDANNPATAAKVDLLKEQLRGLQHANDQREAGLVPIEDTIQFTDIVNDMFVKSVTKFGRRLAKILPPDLRPRAKSEVDELAAELTERAEQFKAEIATPKPDTRRHRR